MLRRVSRKRARPLSTLARTPERPETRTYRRPLLHAPRCTTLYCKKLSGRQRAYAENRITSNSAAVPVPNQKTIHLPHRLMLQLDVLALPACNTGRDLKITIEESAVLKGRSVIRRSSNPLQIRHLISSTPSEELAGNGGRRDGFWVTWWAASAPARS